MKFLKYLSLFLFLSLLTMTSCKKEELHTSEIISEEVTPTQEHTNGLIIRSVTNTGSLDLGCLTIAYPFQMMHLDNTIVDITSEDDFLAAMDDFDNPLIDFVYPLDVTLEDGSITTVNNADELGTLFIDCVPDNGWNDDFPDWFFPAWNISFENSCYQLIYPLNLLTVDSASVTVNNEDELLSYLSDGNLYSFSFPILLEDQDGNNISADTPDNLFDLLADCGPGSGSGGCGIGTIGCYEINYPIDLLLQDGSTITVNNDDEFADVFLNEVWVGFDYPISLIDEEGNTFTVNSEDELMDALMACDGYGGGPGEFEGDFLCYDFVYPFSIIDPSTNSSMTINNSDEWQNYFMTYGPLIELIEYPVTLISVETSEETEINTIDEFYNAIEDCF